MIATEDMDKITLALNKIANVEKILLENPNAMVNSLGDKKYADCFRYLDEGMNILAKIVVKYTGR